MTDTAPQRPFTVTLEDFDDPDAVRLRAAARIEIDGMYGRYPDQGAPLTAASIAAFFMARDETGAPLGCGAIVPVQDGVYEIRRLYVRSEARGTGIATAIVHALEEAARMIGAPALVLETGSEQRRTVRFFEREGYGRIANFGPYAGQPLSVCFAKVL